MRPNDPSDRDAAVEQELREALDSAWADYQQAGPADKAQARGRYEQALRRFVELVLPRSR